MVRTGTTPGKPLPGPDEPSTSRDSRPLHKSGDFVSSDSDSSDSSIIVRPLFNKSARNDSPPRINLSESPSSGIRSPRKRYIPSPSPIKTKRVSPRKPANVINYETSSDDSSEDETNRDIQTIDVKKNGNTGPKRKRGKTLTSVHAAQNNDSRDCSELPSSRPGSEVPSVTLPIVVQNPEPNVEEPREIVLSTPKKIVEAEKEASPQPGPSGISTVIPVKKIMCRKTVTPQAIPTVASLKRTIAETKNNGNSSNSSVADSAAALAKKKRAPAKPKVKATRTKPVPSARIPSPEPTSLLPRFRRSLRRSSVTPVHSIGEEATRTAVFVEFVTQMLRNDERLNPALYQWKVRKITETLMENEIPDEPRI